MYEPESSAALGFGFRCGFLGLLHMEIVQERLEREFDLDLIASAPSVEYHVQTVHGTDELIVDNPAQMPNAGDIETISEPWVEAQVLTPTEHIGPIMELVHQPARRVQEHGVRRSARGSISTSRCRWPS